MRFQGADLRFGVGLLGALVGDHLLGGVLHETLVRQLLLDTAMEYYSAIKNNEFMKFWGKWMYLEDIILSEVTQSQKNSFDMHSLISEY